jgi:hypothetical protein
MRELTGATRIRIKASRITPARKPLTGDTRIRLDQIKDLWILDFKFKDGDVTTHADGSVWKRDAPGKWHQVKTDKYTRQAQEEYKKNPFDKNGNHFVKNSKGNINLGYITKAQAKAMGKRPAPIRLSEGHAGMGSAHALKHLKELPQHYNSMPEFIEDVVNSYDEIKVGDMRTRRRKNGSEYKVPGYILFRKKDVGCVLIEYEPSKYGEDFYTVNTAGIFKHDKRLNNRNVVWVK